MFLMGRLCLSASHAEMRKGRRNRIVIRCVDLVMHPALGIGARGSKDPVDRVAVRQQMRTRSRTSGQSHCIAETGLAESCV
jgi:hypothetical protein